MITPKEIKAIRKKVGGRLELALNVGLKSEATIYRWERGAAVPHQVYEKKLRKIEKKLNEAEAVNP
jgi:DNA-binding transcriptional regulator YiaG